MTRQVAIGAVAGFAVTVLALTVWERSTRGGAADAGVDAGAVMLVPAAVQPRTLVLEEPQQLPSMTVQRRLPAALRPDAGAP